MEESDLLKERLQAITEKHRIQEDIRQKKLELDQEKLKLQHLKKKSLREQWLLQNTMDSPQRQTLLCDQQQTSALQLNIHRIEKEVESLECEESMISTNESFILTRLKAVEKSPEEIIKEAQESFVPEPLQIATLIPDVPETPSPPASDYTELNAARQTLFAMEINVTKNMLTGESTVLSTATVAPEELNQHNGHKVYDDGRKCVYALNSQEGSHDLTCVSELSASEVEQLLRSATIHRQVNYQRYPQNPSRQEEHCFYNPQDAGDCSQACDPRNQRHYVDHVLSNNVAETDFSCTENWQRKPQDVHRSAHSTQAGCHYSRQDVRHNENNLRDGHRFGKHKAVTFHYNNHKDHCDSYQFRNSHSAQGYRTSSHHNNGIIRSNSCLNGVRPNGCPPPRSHEQEAVSSYHPQLSTYSPANYIPLTDYISVDEEELYCYSPPSYQTTALYNAPPPPDRVPSPLYGDDTAYTILSAMETAEPVTAIFMGFQTAQDDIGRGQEFEGSLKAELVIIEDNEENSKDSDMKEKKSHMHLGVQSSAESTANGGVGRAVRRVGPGIKSIQKKHRPCCTIC